MMSISLAPEESGESVHDHGHGQGHGQSQALGLDDQPNLPPPNQQFLEFM